MSEFNSCKIAESTKSSAPTVWSFVTNTCLVHVDRRSDIVRWFMPSWFTVCMGTGVLASCIGRVSNDIPALQVLGSVIFFANIAVFVVLLCIQIAQLIIFPGIASYMRHHPRRMLHYGAISMSFGVIVTGIVSLQYSAENRAALYIAWTVWWLSLLLALLSSVLFVYLLVSRQTQSIESVTGAWLLLVAPLTVCATSGGSIAAYLPADLALLTTMAGYCILGAGVPLTCCLLVLYMHRITVHKLPAHDAILTAFIPLGPLSQIGVALLVLGSIAQELLPQVLPHLGSLGTSLFHVGIAGALLSWGCSVFSIIHAVFSVLYQRRIANIPFNISWWALTFPVGVFARLTSELGQALRLNFFNILFLVLVVVLFGLWLFNIVCTAAGAWTGSIFGISELMTTCECCRTDIDQGKSSEEKEYSIDDVAQHV